MKHFLLYIWFAFIFALENKTLSHIKQYSRWMKDLYSGDNTLGRELPWMTYDAIFFLDRISQSGMTVFEWGSGGSTLFFARRTDKVVSVEHDDQWSKFLLEKINELPVKNVDYRYIQPNIIEDWNERDYKNPDHFISGDSRYNGLSFEYYVKVIDEYPTLHFDIVVVDGRARNCCIKRAIPHIKEGGYLVVDNADRKYYLDCIPELEDDSFWEKVEFQGPVFFQHAFSKTVVYRKLVHV